MVKAIILLAGNGTRVNAPVPKQFIKIKNKPLFVYTVETFHKIKEIDQIILVTRKDYLSQVKLYTIQHKLKKVVTVIEGGETRQKSVYNALSQIGGRGTDIILIHDAARVGVTNDIILSNINECRKHNIVLTAIGETDTIYKKGDNGLSLVDRSCLYKAQTPQTFRLSIIKGLHEKYKNDSFTDDISLAIKDGLNPYIVIGSENNFKITTNYELEKFKSLVESKK